MLQSLRRLEGLNCQSGHAHMLTRIILVSVVCKGCGGTCSTHWFSWMSDANSLIWTPIVVICQYYILLGAHLRYVCPGLSPSCQPLPMHVTACPTPELPQWVCGWWRADDVNIMGDWSVLRKAEPSRRLTTDLRRQLTGFLMVMRTTNRTCCNSWPGYRQQIASFFLFSPISGNYLYLTICFLQDLQCLL